MKMEQIECSETSAYKIQMPGNHPEENIQHTEHGESLKSKMIIVTMPLLLQYHLLTKHDPRCARLVSSMSRDDELPPHTDPTPHPFTWGGDQMHFLKHAALNSWWWTKSRANSLECKEPMSEPCKITIFFFLFISTIILQLLMLYCDMLWLLYVAILRGWFM
jgi:hypothetical protein